MKFVGVGGRAGHGKSTFADALRAALSERHGVKVEIIAFADAMKDALAAMFSVDRVVFDDPSRKATPCDELGGATPRRVMQAFGTEGVREGMWRALSVPSGSELALGPWIFALSRRAEASGADFVIVPDVRFRDEAAWLASKGAEMFFVDGTGRAPPTLDEHASETLGPEAFDEVIFNREPGSLAFAAKSVADACVPP